MFKVSSVEGAKEYAIQVRFHEDDLKELIELEVKTKVKRNNIIRQMVRHCLDELKEEGN